MADEQVTKDRAKQLIDKADCGFLVIGKVEPKDVIGSVPDDERETTTTVETVRFGDWDGADLDE